MRLSFCSDRSDRSRRAFRVSNPGRVGVFISTLLVDGVPVCMLQDVFDAISRACDGDISDLTVEEQAELTSTGRLIQNIVIHSYSLLAVITGDYDDYFANPGKNFELGDPSWQLIASISALCVYPKIMSKVSKEIVAKGTIEEESMKWLQRMQTDTLVFTFALRSILARLAFYTKLTNIVGSALEQEMDDNNYILDPGLKCPIATFAFVGFNRLLSPNNKTGVSYSSDIDYKLVIDSSYVLQSNLEPLTSNQVKGIIKALNAAQMDVKDYFGRDAKMLLEVEKFTTRDLKELETLAHSDPHEQNFLASIYRNNIHIAGSGKVYSDFVRVLEKKEETDQGLEVARRTWTQFLGKSDKGSVKWIAKTEEVKNFVAKAVHSILSNEAFDNSHLLLISDLVVKELNLKGELKKDFLDYVSCLNWLCSPKIFKTIIGNSKIKNMLLTDSTCMSELDKLDMFESDADSKERLGITAKVYAGLVDDDAIRPESATACLYQIGSTMTSNEHWRFSLKFAGCRPNDFFDSVQKEDYNKWVGNTGNEDKYVSGQQLAAVINEFSLRMQNFIYELASTPADIGGEIKTHEEIDTLYSRITKQHFKEMIDRSIKKNDGNIHLKKALKKLYFDLRHLKSGLNIELLIDEAKNLADRVSETPFDDSEDDGRKFFSALFDVSNRLADYLVPGVGNSSPATWKPLKYVRRLF